jgi:HK97 family phage major capsid protein
MPNAPAKSPEAMRREAAELQKQADERFKSLGPDYTPEQFAEVDTIVTRANELVTEAAEAEAAEQRLNDLAARMATIKAANGAAPSTRNQHDVTDPRGVAYEVKSSALRGAQARDPLMFSDFLVQLARTLDPVESRRADEVLRNKFQSRRNEWADAPEGSERRTLAQSSGITGGYTVPIEFYNQLMQVAGETGLVRPRATALQMGADVVEIPILDQTTAPTAGKTSFYGGVSLEWTADTAEKPETEPKFRQAKLSAHELSGYTEISRSLLANSAVSLTGLVTSLFGQAVAWAEDFAFLRGNGVGKPFGIVPWLETRSGTVTSARGSNSAITFANAVSVWVKRQIINQGRTAWMLSKAAESAFLQMTGTANTVVIPTGFYVQGTNGSGAAQQPINYALMGLPVLVSEKLPALNTLGDFMLADFSQYVIGDRGQMEIAVSEHYKFRNNVVCYRIIHRVAGMPWLNDAITLSDASTTVSPFVGLQVQ